MFFFCVCVCAYKLFWVFFWDEKVPSLLHLSFLEIKKNNNKKKERKNQGKRQHCCCPHSESL